MECLSVFIFPGIALKEEQNKEANKRHTLSNPPEHIPELDSPRQSRSPLKNDKKEKVKRVELKSIEELVFIVSVSKYVFFKSRQVIHSQNYIFNV